MKIQAKVLAVKDNLIKVEVAKPRFKVGDNVHIVKGSTRTLSQNNFYWTYLTYVIENGAKEYGHYSVEGLHQSLKAYFLAEKKLTKGEWKELENATTTDLSKLEFSEYMDKIDHFICDTFEMDTSSFFEDYQNIYRPGKKRR